MKIKKPTRQELRDIRKIQRSRTQLGQDEDAACHAIAEKYCPCKVGDIIEGGIHLIERGKVTHRACYVFGDGTYQLRVSYLPLRGKRYLKHCRSFKDMSTIRVIEPAARPSSTSH